MPILQRHQHQLVQIQTIKKKKKVGKYIENKNKKGKFSVIPPTVPCDEMMETYAFNHLIEFPFLPLIQSHNN